MTARARRSARAVLCAAGTAAALLLAPAAGAHRASDAYLELEASGDRISGSLSVALRDVELLSALDEDHDARVTWGEVRRKYPEVARTVLSSVHVSRGGAPCNGDATNAGITRHSDGAYLVLGLTWMCGGAEDDELGIRYELLFDADARHRGLTRLTAGRSTQTFAFSAADRERRLRLREPDRLATWLGMTSEGMRHIAGGYDHLLFLLALVLPAVLRREDGEWVPAASFRPVFLEVLKTATAFTAAHSVTLALAAFDVVALPSRVVESAIAATVLLAALNNVFPLVKGDRWQVAFPIGLLHGFGFAGALSDLGAHGAALALPLLAFNGGVELGQVLLLSAVLPLVHAARRLPSYPRYCLAGGSLAIAVTAAVWLVERAFDVRG